MSILECLPRDIVILSTADWDNPFWTNKQHVAAGLAAAGHRVLYMESLGLRRPRAHGRDLGRIARRFKRAWAGARLVRPNLWVIAPLALPWHGPWVNRLNRRLVASRVAGAARRLGFDRPLVWVYNPLTVDWLEALAPGLVLYHAVDELGAIPGVSAAAIRTAEERLCQRADLVVATSPVLTGRLEGLAPGRVHHLPNVVDYGHFARPDLAAPADLDCIPRPRIGFVGALADYKVDFALIDAVAALRPDWHWVLIGQLGEGQPDSPVPACLTRPNVHFLGPRPYDAVPAYLNGFDAAALPMRRNAYTAAMFPMKFFEYLAAGRPVIATQLPSLDGYRPLFLHAEGADGFAHALDEIRAGRRPDPAACAAAARAHGWEWRMGEINRLVMLASRPRD